MIVEKDKVVSFNYTLKDEEGNLLDSSDGREALAYLHGAGNIIPGLEDALSGKSPGDDVTAVIEPAQAYGQRDDSLVGQVPRENLDGIDELKVGMQLEARTPEGPRVVHVVDVADDSVTIDANHPLAGKTLHFDLTVAEVRDATTEELEHRHPHGPGGHQH